MPEQQRRCNNCKQLKDLAAFRPGPGEACARRRRVFDAAVTWVREDACAESEVALEAARTRKCFSCRESHSRSKHNPVTNPGQCRVLWNTLRNAPCSDCGRTDGVEYDHQPALGAKLHKVSAWQWWACHGGVEAMRNEVAKCVPRCAVCHRMQPSFAKFAKRKYVSTSDMPEESRANRAAKRQRQHQDDKLRYVSERKLALGGCEDCALDVTLDTVHCFDFAHVDAAKKQCTVSTVCYGGGTLQRAKQTIDDEIARCRLLCCVCHRRETRVRSRRDF